MLYGGVHLPYFSNKRAVGLEHVRGDIQRGQNELRLHILVYVMQACDVWRPIRHLASTGCKWWQLGVGEANVR